MTKEDKTAVDSPTIIAQAQDRFTDIATDLFNIEVNTILRDDITAQKMPTSRHALIDIGKTYKKAMEQMEPAYSSSTASVTRTIPEMMAHNVGDCYGSFNGFNGLREWADRLLDDVYAGKIKLHADQIAILPRIKDNSDLLKGMFTNIVRTHPNAASEQKSLTNNYSRRELNGFEDIPTLLLSEQQLVLIRKIWELGTEVIIMQTIVQVDGDVITRLNANYLDNAHYPKIRDYHNKGIEIALKHWISLVNVAKELMITAGQGISSAFK